VLQPGPELKVVEHPVQPGIAEFIRNDIPYAAQVQPATIRDGGEVFTQAAINRPLASDQQPLEGQVVCHRQYPAIVAVYRGDAEN